MLKSDSLVLRKCVQGKRSQGAKELSLGAKEPLRLTRENCIGSEKRFREPNLSITLYYNCSMLNVLTCANYKFKDKLILKLGRKEETKYWMPAVT